MFTLYAISLRINWLFATRITFSSFKPFQKQQPQQHLYNATISQPCSGQPHLSFCLSQQYGTSWVPCQVRKSMFSLNQAKSPLRTSSLWWTILRLKLPLKIKALLYISVPGYRGSIAKNSFTNIFLYFSASLPSIREQKHLGCMSSVQLSNYISKSNYTGEWFIKWPIAHVQSH